MDCRALLALLSMRARGNISARSFVIALALVLGAASAEAAIFSNAQGQVTLQTPQGTRVIAVSSEAAPGAVVSTGPTGSVTINYASGCYQTLRPNQRVVIDEAVCATYRQAGNGAGGQSLLADPGVVIGGTAAIGIIGGLLLTNRGGGGGTPGSP